MKAFEFSGSPRAAGAAHGETFRKSIHELANIRLELTLGKTDFKSVAEIVSLGEKHLPLLQAASPDLYEEFCAMAEAADIGKGELVVLNHYTDLRDLSRSTLYDDQGCSAVFLPGTPPVLGQTWDMHGSAAPYVEAMRFAVDGAPRCLTFSLTGCMGMAGINEHGVAVTINNLNTPTTTLGLIWPALVRMMLACETAKQAKVLLERIGVGSGHYYQISDRNDFYGIEALAGQQRCITYWSQGGRRELTYPSAACHTNHCLSPEQAELEVLPQESTTFVRWDALQERLQKTQIEPSPEAMWELLSDRRLSMLISEELPHKSATCGGLVFDWTGELPAMRICRGPLTGQTGVLLNV
ncbi:MAG: C45 family autoproteolytic acyltransferase/hydrolase [Myxococcota bacterium]|nr:C45 family autoproteolytic acyltransferase/hydrolase [Myxococcota bacterium]